MGSVERVDREDTISNFARKNRMNSLTEESPFVCFRFGKLKNLAETKKRKVDYRRSHDVWRLLLMLVLK